MTNVILCTNGTRPRLLEQTLKTLRGNTPAGQYNLTVVCDGDIGLFGVGCDGIETTLTIDPPCNIIGRLKNAGAYWSEKQFGRGEWLIFIDDDMAFLPGWQWKMEYALMATNDIRLLGGVRHPFHGVNAEVGLSLDKGNREDNRHKVYRSDSLSDPIPSFITEGIDITDAVAGYCHFMRWSTWDRFGPYDSHAKGTGQSEDYALCRKIVDAGGKVGYIHPPVMAHCGLTSSEGKRILGAELIEHQAGVIYE